MHWKRAVIVIGVLLLLVAPATAQGDDTAPETPLHRALEAGQVLFAFTALLGVSLASRRLGGGLLSQSLILIGAGILMVALQRLWHSLAEFALLGEPPVLVSNGLFLVALALFTAGFVHIYWNLQ